MQRTKTFLTETLVMKVMTKLRMRTLYTNITILLRQLPNETLSFIHKTKTLYSIEFFEKQ